MKFLRNLLKPKSQTVVVVSGLPRSGTSMMMKMLEAGGLEVLTDHIRTPNEDNPKGYYEFERVKKLPDGDVAWLPEAQGRVVKIISALLKHLPPTHTYKVLFMRRRMSEILASQQQMLVRRGEATDKVSDEEMTRLFEKHLEETFAWMAQQPNLTCLEVDYNAMLADPRPQVAQLQAFLDMDLDTQAMLAVVDPELYRQRA
ncbi:MAG TPA: sulfotransferase family protein [Anaerolineae bacterium]|nr:sulfotransferase family protein [Anaerolineae bacterium]